MTDDQKLKLIQDMLRKAERTEFAEEAEAFLVKAQELMARYSIDEAMLQARSIGVKATPVQDIYFVYGPFAKAKSQLLSAIAKQNSCRLLVDSTLTDTNLRVYLFGFDNDVSAVKAMYSSMIIVAASEMIRARHRNQRVHGKAFAQSFYLGFAHRLGERLEEMNRQVLAEYTGSVALVLVDRKKDVDSMVSDTYSKLGKTRLNNSSRAGAVAGRDAANRANLNKSVSGSNRALGR